ncbi:MAG: nucleotidyltransferase domain-containing protein [Candidatus Heimdallarchaeota archaeon]
MDQKLFRELKEDFKELAKDNEIHAILAFGSSVSGENTARSDVDVCIVAPAAQDRVEVLRRAWRQVGGKYDLWLFEELPLYIQAEILQNHQILYCSDIPALFEYFYPVRKLISDMIHRQRVAMMD